MAPDGEALAECTVTGGSEEILPPTFSLGNKIDVWTLSNAEGGVNSNVAVPERSDSVRSRIQTTLWATGWANSSRLSSLIPVAAGLAVTSARCAFTGAAKRATGRI